MTKDNKVELSVYLTKPVISSYRAILNILTNQDLGGVGGLSLAYDRIENSTKRLETLVSGKTSRESYTIDLEEVNKINRELDWATTKIIESEGRGIVNKDNVTEVLKNSWEAAKLLKNNLLCGMTKDR